MIVRTVVHQLDIGPFFLKLFSDVGKDFTARVIRKMAEHAYFPGYVVINRGIRSQCGRECAHQQTERKDESQYLFDHV